MARASRANRRRVGGLALAGLFAVGLVGQPAMPAAAVAARAAQDTFAARIAALSEPSGYFDTDNLISNEQSYLHAVTDLANAGVRGGAYLGVGPDQNFSYIAQVRPTVAVLVDIRRDNLLLHLLFKALFSAARTRVEYLALLTGRSVPTPTAAGNAKALDSIAAIVVAVDGAQVLSATAVDALCRRTAATIQSFGVPLTPADLATIDRFHRRFIAAGLSLQFNSTGRAPQADYPTYRDLLLETDRRGVHRSFLSTDANFQFVKSLQARDLVIPVVGDLSGASALAAIGRWLTARQERLSAFYVSNVEFYLFRDGSFGRFVANLGRFPLAAEAVIIRSIFGGQALRVPGYNSASLTQPIRALLDGHARGQFRSYWELAGRTP